MPVTFTVDDTDRGTDEHTWTAWLSGWERRPTEWPAIERVLVIAPHPDDEVLGVGGTMRCLHERGASVTIVAVTDGEACRAGSTADEKVALRATRRLELRVALARLEVPAEVVHLALPDGAVADHERSLIETLTTTLAATGAQWCLAPWRHDGHPDHEAVGRAAVQASSRAGVRVAEYPIWAWHWSSPGDPRVPWRRATQVPLPAHVQAAKTEAIGAFASQLTGLRPHDAVLPPHVLAHFSRPFEVLFR